MAADGAERLLGDLFGYNPKHMDLANYHVDRVEECLRALPNQRWRTLLEWLYGIGTNDPITAKEAAARLGVTRSRVYQIRHDAMRHLRHPRYSRQLVRRTIERKAEEYGPRCALPADPRGRLVASVFGHDFWQSRHPADPLTCAMDRAREELPFEQKRALDHRFGFRDFTPKSIEQVAALMNVSPESAQRLVDSALAALHAAVSQPV